MIVVLIVGDEVEFGIMEVVDTFMLEVGELV